VKPPSVNVDDLAVWIEERAGTSTRFLFGIAGAPGSGKSTITEPLARVLGAVVVPMDGFHLSNEELDRRGLRSVKGAPETFDARGFIDAVGSIRRADGDVSLPDFDRYTDEPRPNRIQVPASASIVIVEGNYLLLDSDPWFELRSLFDAVACLEIDAEVRVKRLVDRHVRFGKTRAEAVEFVQTSDEPNAALVEAARHRAHLIVDGGS
jgi:pantothenate kinase